MDNSKKNLENIPGKRLRLLLSEYNVKQKDLCSIAKPWSKKESYFDEGYISKVLNNTGVSFTARTAQFFIDNFFPGVRYQWLMGYDDFKTIEEYEIIKENIDSNINIATAYILNYALTSAILGHDIDSNNISSCFTKEELMKLQEDILNYSEWLITSNLKKKDII